MIQSRHKDKRMVWGLLLILVAAMFSCSDSDNSVNCSLCGELVTSGLGESVSGGGTNGDSVQLGLNFYSDKKREGNSLLAEGRLHVNRLGATDSLCEIPRGVYEVTTLIGGNVDASNSLSGFVLQATGPVWVELSVSRLSLIENQKGLVSCSGRPYPNKMIGEVLIKRGKGSGCVGRRLGFDGTRQFFCLLQ